jgi:hypothetical protein
MFDGLRGDPPNSGFDDSVEYFPDDAPAPPASRPNARRKPAGKFLGLNAQQRFILSLLLMVAVCVLGAMCMLVFGKFVIP